MEKIFLSAPFSQQISAQDSSKYNWHEKFFKNLLIKVDFNLWVPPLTRVAFYISGLENKNKYYYYWKIFVREQLLLDLAHLETPIQPTAVYFRAHKRKFTIHHLSRCHRCVSKYRDQTIFGAFLSTNRHEPFFERLTNSVGPNANEFLWQSNVHAILNVCWSH